MLGGKTKIFRTTLPILYPKKERNFNKIPQEVKDSWKDGTFVFISALDGSIVTGTNQTEVINTLDIDLNLLFT
jgi:hypothetical protein